MYILFFGIDCFIEYSNDTYAILEDGLLNTAIEVAGRNARPVLSLFYLFWVITPFSEIQFYYFSYLMAVICLTLTLYILQDEPYRNFYLYFLELFFLFDDL